MVDYAKHFGPYEDDAPRDPVTIIRAALQEVRECTEDGQDFLSDALDLIADELAGDLALDAAPAREEPSTGDRLALWIEGNELDLLTIPGHRIDELKELLADAWDEGVRASYDSFSGRPYPVNPYRNLKEN